MNANFFCSISCCCDWAIITIDVTETNNNRMLYFCHKKFWFFSDVFCINQPHRFVNLSFPSCILTWKFHKSKKITVKYGYVVLKGYNLCQLKILMYSLLFCTYGGRGDFPPSPHKWRLCSFVICTILIKYLLVIFNTLLPRLMAGQKYN